MTEALSEVAGWALRQGDIWRIGAVCDVENSASARVMEKSGFEREGVSRIDSESVRRLNAAKRMSGESQHIRDRMPPSSTSLIKGTACAPAYFFQY
jgi:RimJ/RimL family protein N-acetyltransferase